MSQSFYRSIVREGVQMRDGFRWTENRLRRVEQAAALRREQAGKMLVFIVEYERTNGCAPAVRDIANAFGCSTSVVQDRLDFLERDGWIKRTAGRFRSIKVLHSVG